MKFFTYSFFILSIFSCTNGLKPRNVEEYYASSGVEKYFLPDIPLWANFSSSARCFREQNIRYFNIDILMKSYSLKYAEALQIQASFNEEYLGTKKNKLAIVTLKEEERFFFEASDKINNHINFFTSPSFKKIHLIWLDEALKGKKEEEKFRKFLKSSVHDNGQPILISACLTKNEIESKFPDLPIRAISAELFSIYSEEGERQPEIHVNLDSFFKAEQEIIFYTQELKKPTSEIQGKFKLMNY